MSCVGLSPRYEGLLACLITLRVLPRSRWMNHPPLLALLRPCGVRQPCLTPNFCAFFRLLGRPKLPSNLIRPGGLIECLTFPPAWGRYVQHRSAPRPYLVELPNAGLSSCLRLRWSMVVNPWPYGARLSEDQRVLLWPFAVGIYRRRVSAPAWCSSPLAPVDS